MNTTTFLAAVAEIASARPVYRAGGDGSDGTCDCIGLIIGAMARCGESWRGVHGSNWAARHAVGNIRAIDDGLAPGDLVFKTRLPLDPAWDLPDRYADDPDQTDYYHVGVVTGVEPLRIVHCTTPGILADDSADAWDCAASLTALTPLETRYVTAASGQTVNLRRKPGGALLTRVPVGTAVAIEATQGDWSRLTVNGRTGWMLTKYLQGEQKTALPADLVRIITELRKCVAELEALR